MWGSVPGIRTSGRQGSGRTRGGWWAGPTSGSTREVRPRGEQQQRVQGLKASVQRVASGWRLVLFIGVDLVGADTDVDVLHIEVKLGNGVIYPVDASV